MRFYKLNENGGQSIDIPNTYEALKKELSWDDAWNTPTINIKGIPFIIICSDLGKLKHMKVSCLSYNNIIEPTTTLKEPFIVGEVIITKFDGTDDFEALSDNDIDIIESRLIEMPKLTKPMFYNRVLVID